MDDISKFVIEIEQVEDMIELSAIKKEIHKLKLNADNFLFLGKLMNRREKYIKSKKS
jgi:hypothetical protein